MKKRVNIKINAPIYNVIPPITRTLMNVEMSTGDIRNCICAKATVEEILDNGKVITLNLYNYNKDNNPPIKKEEPKKEIKKEEQAKPKEVVNVKIQQPKKEEQVHPGPIQEKPVAEQPKKPIGETKKEVKHEQKSQKLAPEATVKKEEEKLPVGEVKEE